MQLWLSIDWKKHPEAGKKGVREIEQQIYEATIEKGALFSTFTSIFSSVASITH
jgi:hypothetical protein